MLNVSRDEQTIEMKNSTNFDSYQLTIGKNQGFNIELNMLTVGNLHATKNIKL